MPHPISRASLRLLLALSAIAALSACAGAPKESDWYYHWNCNGDSQCLATNPAGTATGVANEGPQQVSCTELLTFAAHFWGSGAVNWCDQSASSHGPMARLAVTPGSATIPVGLTQQYTATGTYADGATVDLTSQVVWQTGGVHVIGVTPVAAISGGGLATAEATGSISITATYGSLTGSATLYVSAAALESIDVTPPNPSVKQGLKQQLTAVGHYSDGTTGAVSGAAWSSSDSSVATIDATGLATTGAPGSTTATASFRGISGSTLVTVVALQSITLGPATPSVPVGRTVTLTATGHYADGSTGDLSSAAGWTSDTPSVATVSGPIVTGVALGTSLVTASWGGISGSVTVTVTAAALNNITVSPGTATIAVGGTKQFTATAHYSDGSSAVLGSGVSWSASCVPSCATIDSSGLATGTDVATALVTAAFSGKSANASLTVTALAAHWDVAYAGTSGLAAVASNGAQVVAVGGDGVIFTSPDGLTWTRRSSGTSEALRGIAWSGTTWVAAGGSGLAAVVLTSPDGVTWTPRSTTATYYFLSLAWGGGQFVAGCYDYGIWTSPDGITWTPRATASDWGNAFAWTGTRWVGGGNALLTSPDAITWTASAVTDTFHGIVWTGSQLVAVGGARTIGQPGSVSTSPDGLGWTEQAAGTTDTLYGVTWKPGSLFAAVGVSATDGTGAIVTSPDGVTWTARPPGTTAALYGITWTGSRFVAVGAGGVVLTSP